MYPFRPLFARLKGKIHKESAEDFSSETVEISPAIVSKRPAAIYADDELQRITSTYESYEFELSRIAGGARREGATIGYAIDDAIISRGVLYKKGYSSYLRSDAPRFVDISAAKRKKEGVLVTNAMCEEYFGHWLSESLLLRLVAEEWDKAPIQLARRPYLHQPDYEAMARLPAEAVNAAQFERLWIIDDRGMNASRRARMMEVRRRIRSIARPEASSGKVFLLRGASARGRYIINLAEVIDFVARYGFSIVNPEKASAREVTDALCAADFVMTVEGSAQKHALLAMPAGSCLIILEPSNRFTAPAKDIADLIDLKFAFTVVESRGPHLRVDLRRLKRLFQMLGT